MQKEKEKKANRKPFKINASPDEVVKILFGKPKSSKVAKATNRKRKRA